MQLCEAEDARRTRLEVQLETSVPAVWWNRRVRWSRQIEPAVTLLSRVAAATSVRAGRPYCTTPESRRLLAVSMADWLMEAWVKELEVQDFGACPVRCTDQEVMIAVEKHCIHLPSSSKGC